MNRNALGIVGGIVVCMAGALGNVAAADVGPFGPPIGVKADVVRAFTMKVSGR